MPPNMPDGADGSSHQGTSLAGIVLCGGKSSRMGRPKAWLPFGGEVLLQRVVRILGSVARPLIVVAAPGQSLPALPGEVEVVHDDREFWGPLQGLAGGLSTLQGRAEAAYLSACDVPFLMPAFVQRLAALRGQNAVCVPRVDGFHHPLAAVYRADVLPTVLLLLEQQRLRPAHLFEEVPTRVVDAAELRDVDPRLWSLRNLNHPADYEAALVDGGLIPTNE